MLREKINRVRCGHVTCNIKIPWEHSPTWNKNVEVARLNRGAHGLYQLRYRPPILPRLHYTHGPSLCKPSTWRPTRAPTWTHVVAWPLATWPRTVRLLRPAWATHGSATWPQRRVAPVWWSRAPLVTPPLGPLATSAPAGKISLFRDFSKENP